MKNYAKDGEVMYHTGLCREMIDHARIAVVPGGSWTGGRAGTVL